MTRGGRRFSPAHLAFFIVLLGSGAFVLALLGLDAWNEERSGRPGLWVVWLISGAGILVAAVVPYGRSMKGGGFLFALVGVSSAAAVSQLRGQSMAALALVYFAAAAATATTVVRVTIEEMSSNQDPP